MHNKPVCARCGQRVAEVRMSRCTLRRKRRFRSVASRTV
jgi:hypothetical protein